MSDTPKAAPPLRNVVDINTPVRDMSVVTVLRDLLQLAEHGQLHGVAISAMSSSGEWRHLLAGGAMHAKLDTVIGQLALAQRFVEKAAMEHMQGGSGR